MLTDLGLQTPEQILKHKERVSQWLEATGGGCISELVCNGCSHLIADSICLCSGYFICPNCQLVNGKENCGVVIAQDVSLRFTLID